MTNSFSIRHIGVHHCCKVPRAHWTLDFGLQKNSSRANRLKTRRVKTIEKKKRPLPSPRSSFVSGNSAHHGRSVSDVTKKNLGSVRWKRTTKRGEGGERGGNSRSIEARAVIILSATRRTSGAEPTSREMLERSVLSLTTMIMLCLQGSLVRPARPISEE